MGEETGELEQFVIDRQLEPHVSVVVHLILHDVVADLAKCALENELLFGLAHLLIRWETGLFPIESVELGENLSRKTTWLGIGLKLFTSQSSRSSIDVLFREPPLSLTDGAVFPERPRLQVSHPVQSCLLLETLVDPSSGVVLLVQAGLSIVDSRSRVEVILGISCQAGP